MRNLTEDEMTLVYGGNFNTQALKGANCSSCFEYIAWAVLFEICKKACERIFAEACVGGPETVPVAIAGAIGTYLSSKAQSEAIDNAKEYCTACYLEVIE